MIDKEGTWQTGFDLKPQEPPNVPKPTWGLGSNSNYFFYSHCDVLLDVSVKVKVTEDIVCESTNGPEVGFSFQLNAYAPVGERSAWQQYVLLLLDSELYAAVQNWSEPPGQGTKSIIFTKEPPRLASVPKAKTIPAGYQLEISLRNNAKWRTSWDLILAGGWGGPGDSGLLLYDHVAGVGALYAINRQIWMEFLDEDASWRPSWALATSGGWAGPGDSGLLLYDRANGLAAFYAVNKHGQIGPPLHEEKTRASWDLAVTGGWAGPGNSGLFLYDRATGLAALFKVNDQGHMELLHEEDTRPPTSSSKKQRSPLSVAVPRPSWDLAVTGGWAGPGNSGLMLYDRATGLAAFYAVDEQGHLGPPLHEEKTRTSWDLAVTGGWAGPGESGLLLYDRAAGISAFYAIDSQGRMHLLNECHGWRTSWDVAVTGGWAGPGESGLLLYDRAAGVGAFYAIDNQGRMTLRQQYDNSITGATYVVIDDHGRTVANYTKRLESVSGVTAADLSPIVAFTFNLVAPGAGADQKGENAVLSSGAGTIVYSAASALTALNYEPPCAESQHWTGEEANSVYGQLPAGESTTFIQSFERTDDPTAGVGTTYF